MAKVNYSTTINAPKKKVWHTMLDLNTYKQWTGAFFPGSYYEGSWDKGSEIKFVSEEDGGKSGIQGRIAENIPNEYISIEYLGVLEDGQLKTTNDSSIWVGAHENYHFVEENGLTTVDVELIAENAGEELAETFDGMWPKALETQRNLRKGITQVSFQAYLDNIEKKTGKTPNDFIKLAKDKGFNSDTKAGEIVSWLKAEHELGHGHAMALVRVIKNGPKIGDKHIGTANSHSDDSDTLRLDGIKKR